MSDDMKDLLELNEMSEYDLITDELMWMTFMRLRPSRVFELEFIKNHDVESIERNDQLLLVMTRLYTKHGGFNAFWSGTELDRIFFIVGKGSKKAYTKRYKAEFPSDSYSESGPD